MINGSDVRADGFPKMDTVFKKPPLAPKPKLVSHLTIKLPSPLMSRPCSSGRGPKPPIAPKPKVPHDLKGCESSLLSDNSQEGCANGDLLPSDEELDQENEPEDSLIGGEGLEEEEEPVEPQYYSDALNSGVNENGYEEQREQEEKMMQEEQEDWRLTDSVQTEEVDSLKMMGVSNAGFTIDSVDTVEMNDTDITDDIDTEGSYAGEALTDNDGLSVCDLSITSIEEEEAACYPCETGPGPGQEERGVKEEREQEEACQRVEEEADSTVDAVIEYLSEEPIAFLVKNNIEDLVMQEPSSFKQEDEEEAEESFRNPGSPHNVLQEDNGYDVIGPSNERVERYQPYSIIDEDPMTIQYSMEEGEWQQSHHKAKQLFDTEEEAADPSLEPYYISTEDIVNPEQSPTEGKGHGLAESESTPEESSLATTETTEPSEYAAIGDDDSLCDDSDDMGKIECVSSEDYVEIDNDDDDDDDRENMTGSCQRRMPGVQRVEAFLNQSNNQPRFRLVSISVPADTDTSQASSFSDSQLLSPDDSDVFRDEEDLEGHIVPYLDETTDTEENLSDEHVYEEAGLDSEGENFLPFDRKSIVTRSRSLSGKVPGYVPETVLEEAGSEFHVQNYCEVGLDRSRSALSSSPMLNSTRAKSSSKPHRFLLYPRSFSMEGRDLPLSVYREGQSFPGERDEDSLSLPCVTGSSGSFSQRSPLPSSGLSTPTSMVDIPPPFELAYITKKPITKSSPSLFIEGDSPDRQKKKSSFKRFLMLKFRRKTESKLLVDVNVSSSRSSSESSHHSPVRVLDLDRRSTGSSPQLKSWTVSKPQRSTEFPSTFLFYKDGKRKGGSVAFLDRSVARVESFEDRTLAPFTPLPLTKPRSISFPNADTSDYENIPAQTLNSDYENIQIPSRRSGRPGTFAEFFDHPSRALSSANETDGYVDMSSFPGFERKAQSPEQEPESAYTEAYTMCSIAVGPPAGSRGEAGGGTAGEEDQGRTSEDEEEGGADNTYDRQSDGRSRAFYIAKELLDTERLHVKALKLLQEDFREAVGAAVGDEGDPVLEEERLREILNELPDVYTLHRRILTELENRIRQWEESQRIADIILSRKFEFVVFTTYIGHYDRSMSLLDESCRTSPAFSAIVSQYEQSPAGDNVSLKHQLLQVIVRVAQYRMLLTDYLNNLSPDSREYEDTQAALVVVSDIADQANDSLKHGENLLRLVNIEYSVGGQRDLLQPGRVFVKEGTLMKVSRKCRQPRHLFLMNDLLLYTYPQQDGKYRLKNSLRLNGMKVSKPVIENVQNPLRIEGADISITLAASSCSEREDWFHTLSRTVSDHARGPATFSTCSGEARERLWLSLGEKAPTLVPVSHVMMCMNCTSDFSLTLRRHHCHACGRIVCRSCSRNRYPLKYLKDRMAKVCDHCYSELKKRGRNVSGARGTDSPRSNRRSIRPLSAVFQNIHPPSLWRRKGTTSLTQEYVSEEGSMSGNLQRSKRSKMNWKRLWFLLKDKEKVASESLPLLGFTVKLPDRTGGEETTNVFELYHKKTLYYTFKAEDNHTAKRWVNAIEEATVL